jgi:hypothetical protein
LVPEVTVTAAQVDVVQIFKAGLYCLHAQRQMRQQMAYMFDSETLSLVQ